ncbi:MAG: cysteine hydrolase [Treponema sp.]|nr:cysteine hydrolase [Treponema sp.]
MKKNIFRIGIVLTILITFISACATSSSGGRSGSVDFALVIIDVQNDYFEGGSHTLHNPLGALNNAEKILNQFRTRSLPVIHVQHVNPKGAGFFELDTWGVQIHEKLTPLGNEPVVVKHQISSFAGTELADILKERGINRLIICGMQTNICVETTSKDAKARGFSIVVLEDACAARSIEIHNNAIETLRRDYASITRTARFRF